MTKNGLDFNKPEPNYPYIHDAKGYPNVVSSLAVATKTYKRLGIVVDADEAPANRWMSLQNELNKSRIAIPKDPVNDGLILIEDLPAQLQRVGIWMMPDNKASGMLETFLSTMVDAGNPVWLHAEKATDEAKRIGASFNNLHKDKARVHTWLAWQDPPGMPFGTAITARCFESDSSAALSFVRWFKRLFLD